MKVNRRAFTLVEVIIGFCVASVLIYALYQMLFGGMRTFKRLEGKTHGLESALLAWEIIADDVRANEYFGISRKHFNKVPAVEIGKTKSGGVLGLSRMRKVELAGGRNQGEIEKVVFSLARDGEFGYLKRNEKVYRSIKLRKLEFVPYEVPRSDGEKLSFVSVTLTGWSKNEKDESTLVGLLVLDAHSMRVMNPQWVEVRKRLYGK